jgi:hypothetical protein
VYNIAQKANIRNLDLGWTSAAGPRLRDFDLTSRTIPVLPS